MPAAGGAFSGRVHEGRGSIRASMPLTERRTFQPELWTPDPAHGLTIEEDLEIEDSKYDETASRGGSPLARDANGGST